MYMNIIKNVRITLCSINVLKGMALHRKCVPQGLQVRTVKCYIYRPTGYSQQVFLFFFSEQKIIRIKREVPSP